MMFSIAKKIVLGLIAVVVLIYAGDYVSIHVPIPPGRERFGTRQVKPYYAVPMKDGKVEYMYEDAQTETCSHSLFPQYGHSPCWRESPKPDKQLKLP
jgi:hypothetical protein